MYHSPCGSTHPREGSHHHETLSKGLVTEAIAADTYHNGSYKHALDTDSTHKHALDTDSTHRAPVVHASHTIQWYHLTESVKPNTSVSMSVMPTGSVQVSARLQTAAALCCFICGVSSPLRACTSLPSVELTTATAMAAGNHSGSPGQFVCKRSTATLNSKHDTNHSAVRCTQERDAGAYVHACGTVTVHGVLCCLLPLTRSRPSSIWHQGQSASHEYHNNMMTANRKHKLGR